MYERSASLGIKTLIRLLRDHKDVALIFSMEFSQWMMNDIQGDLYKGGFPQATVERDPFNNKRMIIRSGLKVVESNEDALSYLNSGEVF